MAIPKFEDDIEVISKLGDYPGSDNNLSTDGFRSKFDEAAVKFKRYINNVLIPNLDMIVDVRALLLGILDKTLTMSDKAAEAKATGDALNKKLDKAGGIMTGNIAMSGKRVTGLGDPVEDGDAVTKKFLEDKKQNFSAVLSANGWAGDASPYTQTVPVEGITKDDNPDYWPVYSGTNEERIAQKEGFAVLDFLETADGSITVTCFEEKPEVDITIGMEVHR